jgi:hypothetical protein
MPLGKEKQMFKIDADKVFAAKRNAICAAAAAATLVALGATPADASHFRGGALVPSVSASGFLTVTSTTFWRKSADNVVTVAANGSSMTQGLSVLDTSDARFDKRTVTWTQQLAAGAGTYNLASSSCCRVSGIRNSVGGSSVGWQLNSSIVWDGQTANAPVLFDFSAIQIEVVRGDAYTDNLSAVAGNGGTLSYNNALNLDGGGNFTQTPGSSINTSTGELGITSAATTNLLDNPTGNLGADYLFSGNIINSDGSSVEYDWLWDAVAQASNRAPNVDDLIFNLTVGDLLNTSIGATDPNAADDVTLSLLGFFGPGVGLAPIFTPGAAGNPTSGNFIWDTAGSAVGSYIANIRGSDGSLTDVGSITINLTAGGGGGKIPEPGTLSTMALGLFGLGWLNRRRRRSNR